MTALTAMTTATRTTPSCAPAPDTEAATRAAAALLTALGVDWDTVHMARTPARLAAAYAEMLTAPAFELTTFPNDQGHDGQGHDELVVVRDIAFQSLCEHHLLPFVGVAHVGYLPGERLLGLSKFARLVDFTARAPQTQERLTQQVARQLEKHLRPRGVGVVLEADHSCMTLRGARAGGARTVTSTLLGTLRHDPAARAEFLDLARPARSPGVR
ncbi:GTP cyclohydrolase 1 [Nocardioides dokdonensis FR1436]|uniref:GTP cyclohydrolase 1 n=1 Tax=Nocardioides dokdonensis FR1436 TaxID=1300347 RepID=A0A1A9GJW6_9ACTN|nr:GTP cyclohydrolase I [Nocardioides dokdonensis]ANH38366.1 GTP cyclohydrolase 1 [Nocardioides dokdonensis FR1436]